MTSAIVACWSHCDQELPSRPWLTVNKEVQRLAAPFGIGRSLCDVPPGTGHSVGESWL